MVRCKTIAPKYGVTPKTIRDIWRGRTWIQATEHLWTEEEKIQRAQGDSSSSDDEDGNDVRPSARGRAASNPPHGSGTSRSDAIAANAAPSPWTAASNAQVSTAQLHQAQLQLQMQAQQQSQMQAQQQSQMQAQQQSQLQAQFQAQQAQLQAQLQMQMQGQLLAQLQMQRQAHARGAPAAGEWPPAAGADGGAHLAASFDPFNAPAARSAAAAACGSWPPAASAGWRPDAATMSALAALAGGGNSSCAGGAWGALGDAGAGADRAGGAAAGRLFAPLDATARDAGAWHRAAPCGSGSAGDGWPGWGQAPAPQPGRDVQWGGLRF
jgi:hypothetical protein